MPLQSSSVDNGAGLPVDNAQWKTTGERGACKGEERERGRDALQRLRSSENRGCVCIERGTAELELDVGSAMAPRYRSPAMRLYNSGLFSNDCRIFGSKDIMRATFRPAVNFRVVSARLYWGYLDNHPMNGNVVGLCHLRHFKVLPLLRHLSSLPGLHLRDCAQLTAGGVSPRPPRHRRQLTWFVWTTMQKDP